MANIMINKVCNLQCPYCFANRFVNKDNCIDKNNISIDNFKAALNFLCKNNDKLNIGIIGGEPTLHPDFKQIIEIALNNDKINQVLLFTNGIYLEKCIDFIKNEKFKILINLNSPEDIGLQIFNNIINNIKQMKDKYPNIQDQITIGVNLYNENKDYNYIFEILKYTGINKLRTSIVVPNTNEKKNTNCEEYFLRMKPMVFEFLKECEKNEIIAFYDCNNMPVCLLDEDEKRWLCEYVNKFYKKYKYKSNLLCLPKCSPVIDILPDLTAVRCFGCSENNVNISNFENIYDLIEFFKNKEDNFANEISMNNKCKTCYDKHTQRCGGGCLAFKRKKINKARDIINILDQ